MWAAVTGTLYLLGDQGHNFNNQWPSSLQTAHSDRVVIVQQVQDAPYVDMMYPVKIWLQASWSCSLSSSSCMCPQGLTSAGQSRSVQLPVCRKAAIKASKIPYSGGWGKNDRPYNQVKPESSHFPFREIRWESVCFGGWGCNWEISLNCYRGAFTLEESQVVLVKSYPSPPTHPTPLLLPHSCLLLFPTKTLSIQPPSHRIGCWDGATALRQAVSA